MAKGMTLPMLYNTPKEYKRHRNIDQKIIKGNEWHLPQLSYNHKIGRTQLITIGETTDELKINARDNKISRHSGAILPKKRNKKLSCSVKSGQTKEMFTRMSIEAREAYSQTLKEMAGEETEQYNVSSSHSELCKTSLNSMRLEDTTNSILSSTSTYSNQLDFDEVHNKNNRRHSDVSKQFRSNCLPKLPQRLLQSESRKRPIKRKKQKSRKSSEVNNCKAPFSYTALRIGRRNWTKELDDTETCFSSNTRRSVNNDQYTTRPFEITPLGYDSRYMGVQAVKAPLQYNTDEDEDLAAYVIEKATQKCKHWLAYQSNDSA